ncbi:chemotaxis protein CheX [bacterium]|nr:chemotaxis protein CheX [bacterium]
MEKTALAKAAIETLAMVCGQELQQGDEYKHTRKTINDAIAVKLNIIGDRTGFVLIRFNEENAKKTASAMMMGMPIENLDETALSALSELGNMIMGGATVHLSNVGIMTDITTPSLLTGDVDVTDTVSIPLSNGDMRIVLDVNI